MSHLSLVIKTDVPYLSRGDSCSTTCDHQHAIEAYCRDWNLSGITKSLAFAQKVNQAQHVLNLKTKTEM